jgi:hypothetical protein
MFHLMALHGGEPAGETSYETDRARLHRPRTHVASPQAMGESAALSGTEGSVLDPCVAIRRASPRGRSNRRPRHGFRHRRDARGLPRARRQVPRSPPRGSCLRAGVDARLGRLRQINATESDAQLYARLASSVALRQPGAAALCGRAGEEPPRQSGLWGYAISGDLPIVLARIGDAANIDLVRQLVQAHAYWRLKGLAVDLVIWNEDHAGYRQLLQDQILGLVAAGVEAQVIERPGGIFVRRAEQISDEDRILFEAVARAVLSDQRGTLAEQVARRSVTEPAASRAPDDEPARAATRRACASCARGAGGRAAADPGARLLQRQRRLQRGRARVRHHHFAPAGGRRLPG